MTGRFAQYALSLAALILVGWVGSISWQQLERHKRIESEVARLEAEAEKIRRENETFAERIGYFSSDAFREQEAKRKLGLKKANENVVVIKPAAGATLEGTEPAVSDVIGEGEEPSSLFAGPNYLKWQAVFFD